MNIISMHQKTGPKHKAYLLPENTIPRPTVVINMYDDPNSWPAHIKM